MAEGKSNMNSSMKKIMICERFAIEALVELKKKAHFEVISFSNDEIKNANALIIRSKFKIDLELLEQAKNLELIVTCTSGFDHIDLKETEKRKITVKIGRAHV
jgi:D-3-phosphoglycerate dehydrogenase